MLFFVLIALVVLMLAAAALVRTVDTATIISGNLVFKQAARTSADYALEKAITSIRENKLGDDENAGRGYYASLPINSMQQLSDTRPLSDDTWVDGKSVSIGEDKSGNVVRYIIERVCRSAGDPATSGCLFADVPDNTGSMIAGNPRPKTVAQGVFYRVTAKVTGPRNTVSYVQAFVN